MGMVVSPAPLNVRPLLPYGFVVRNVGTQTQGGKGPRVQRCGQHHHAQQWQQQQLMLQ
jgi:hypothetical protein